MSASWPSFIPISLADLRDLANKCRAEEALPPLTEKEWTAVVERNFPTPTPLVVTVPTNYRLS